MRWVVLIVPEAMAELDTLAEDIRANSSAL
jgi:hypothetical protein